MAYVKYSSIQIDKNWFVGILCFLSLTLHSLFVSIFMFSGLFRDLYVHTSITINTTDFHVKRTFHMKRSFRDSCTNAVGYSTEARGLDRILLSQAKGHTSELIEAEVELPCCVELSIEV